MKYQPNHQSTWITPAWALEMPTLNGEDSAYADGGLATAAETHVVGERPSEFPAFLASRTQPPAPAREHPAASNDNEPERERIGDWIQTFTGKAVYPMDLQASDIAIEDIAHSLSMQCRFNGHCLKFYSVAEHSVMMARHFLANGMAEYALPALLHDATEAYLTDVPRPVKPFLFGYKEAEQRAWLAIAERFSLAAELPAEVHDADSRILFDEKAQNMGAAERDWAWKMEPLGVTLRFWSPRVARDEFMDMYWRCIETGRH